jgi:hypothetical protein
VPRAAAALVLAVLATGCAVRGGEGARVEDVTVGTARFRVHYLPEDAGAARQVIGALRAAAPRAARWGILSSPIDVVLHPTHAALEAAVHRDGYEWLRAWARFGQIDLQSPRTWGMLGASDAEVGELVAHELTHCAMYQLAGDELTWMYKDIPRWFSEGLASVAAGQGYRRGELQALGRYYEDALPGSGGGVAGARARVARGNASVVGDPLLDPDPLYQEQSDVVYGAAHHAVVFLLARYGEERVHRIVKLMGEGQRFPAAFREAIGIGDAEFASDFRRYVVWQGWRKDAR